MIFCDSYRRADREGLQDGQRLVNTSIKPSLGLFTWQVNNSFESAICSIFAFSLSNKQYAAKFFMVFLATDPFKSTNFLIASKAEQGVSNGNFAALPEDSNQKVLRLSVFDTPI